MSQPTNVPKDAPRKIKSAKELRLLTQIYRSQGHLNELLTVLDDPDIGISSGVGLNDFEFVRAKIQTLKDSNKWAELHAYCLGALKGVGITKAEPDSPLTVRSWASDSLIWDGLVESANKL
jgi:hypothetical protein